MNLKKKIAMFTASAIVLAGAGAVKAYAASSMVYKIYDFNTLSERGTYLLSQNAYSETTTYALLNDDNRDDYTNSGVVRLQCGNFYSTGFVVGDHTIATAAENIYRYNGTSNGVYQNNLSITLYDNAGNIISTIYPDEAHFPYGYQYTSTNAARKAYNYAFLSVSEDLSEYEHLKLGEVMTDAANNTTIPVRAAGVDGTPQTSIGRFGTFNNYDIQCSSYTTEPQIGGPVYLTTAYRRGSNAYSSTKTVVGILTESNAYGANQDVTNNSHAIMISSRMLQFYYQNDNNPYE